MEKIFKNIKKIKLGLAHGLMLSGILCLPVSNVSAQGDLYRSRIENQRAAIQRGVESGVLSKYEAQILRQEHHRICRLADDLRNLSPSRQSRQLLEKQLDQADRHIYEMMHNQSARHPTPTPVPAPYHHPYRY